MAGQKRLPDAGEKRVSLHSVHVAAKRLRDEAGEHDIWLQLVDAVEGAEVLPGDPPKPLSPSPGLPDLGIGRAFAKVAAVGHTGRPEAPRASTQTSAFSLPWVLDRLLPKNRSASS